MVSAGRSRTCKLLQIHLPGPAEVSRRTRASEQASKQPRAGTGVHRARGPQRSSPTRTEAKASPAHRHRRSIVLRGAGHSAPEVNGQEAPGAARSPGGRAEAGRARRPSFPAASPLPAARAAVPRTPTPRAASPPPRRAAGWT